MFTEGQTVWCLIYGQGVVTDVDSKRTEETYPVFVKFQNYGELHISYTLEGKFHSQGNITLFPYPVEIVKKVVKPCINWEHVDSKFKYLAEDPCGTASLYEEEPFTALNSWGIHGGEAVEAFMFASYVKGTCDWKESLVKRPTGDSHDD